MSTLVENSSSLFDRAVILKLTLGAPGNTSQLREDQYEVDAEKGRTKAVKRLLDSPEVAKAVKRQNQLRAKIAKLSIRGVSPLGSGTYLLAIGLIQRAEKLIDAAISDMATLLVDVEQAYPERIEEAKKALNGLFNAADYPPVAEFLEAFYITSQYITYAAPEALAQVRGDLLDREKGKITTGAATAYQNVFKVLRMDMKGLVDKLVARVKQASGGDSTKFKGLLDNITEFLEMLPLQNIVDDADLARLGERATEILKDVTPDMLREDTTIRNYVAKEFAGIQAQLNEIVLKPKRMITADAA